MAIEKAKTIKDEIDEGEVKYLECYLGRLEKARENTIKELQIREEIVAIQKKNPKVLKPNFEFESTPEFEQSLIKQWELDLDIKKLKIISELENIDIEIDAKKKKLQEMKGE